MIQSFVRIVDLAEKSKKKKRKSRVIDFTDQSKSILQSIFGGDCTEDVRVYKFKTEIFQKMPCVVRGFNIDSIKEMLFDFDIQKMLEQTTSESIHAWLRISSGEDKDKSVHKKSVIESITIEDPSQAYLLYKAGHSLYCRSSEELESIVVPRLLEELGMGVGRSNNDRYRRGEIETFFSRKGHLTDFHTDFQENFTIQLTGRKVWTFSPSSAISPIRGCTPHFGTNKIDLGTAETQLKVLRLGDINFTSCQYESSSSGELGGNRCQVELSPGDVLYHPAGIWHRVECLEDSIAINVSLIASSYADVFCSGLQQLLMENPIWRGPCRVDSAECFSVIQSMADYIPHLLNGLTARDLLPQPCVKVLECEQEEEDKECDVDRNLSSAQTNDDEQEEENSQDGGSSILDVEEEEEEEKEEIDSKLKSNIVVHVSSFNISSYYEEIIFPIIKTFSSIISPNNTNHFPNSQIVNHLKFRVNPLAQILSDVDLRALAGFGPLDSSSSSQDADEDSSSFFSFVVHCGFGNEALESLSRVVITMPDAYEDYMQRFLTLYTESKSLRMSSFLSSKLNGIVHKKHEQGTISFTVNDIIGVGARIKNKTQQKVEVGTLITTKKRKHSNGDSSTEITSAIECGNDVKNGLKLLFSLHQAGAVTLIP